MYKALTIAGSDPSGGAGIEADIKTMSALGVYAMVSIVSVVAENTRRVVSLLDMPGWIIKDQIDSVFEDITPDAVKVGMLSGPEQMDAVRDRLEYYKPKNVVVDPVMYAKNGDPLMHEDAVSFLIDNILPLSTVLTPNIPEAEKITGMRITDVDEMEKGARKILSMGPEAVLLKGGHHIGDAIDVLVTQNGTFKFKTKRINTKNTHGTGCTLSSAIASFLAKGYSLEDATKEAKDYVTGAIENSLELGNGCGPTNHFYRLWRNL